MAKNSKAAVEVPETEYSVTLRADTGFEYHMTLAESVIEDILDPATPTRFLPVDALSTNGSRIGNTARFLNTAGIKEIDVRGWER